MTNAEMKSTCDGLLERECARSDELVYHYTDIRSAKLIVSAGSSGFRASKAGQGGGGVSVCTLGPHEMGWDQYQGGEFRSTVGRELWGEKAGDVAVGGKDAGKLDVVFLIKIAKNVLTGAHAVPGRKTIRILNSSSGGLMAQGDNHFLQKESIVKAYILKKGEAEFPYAPCAEPQRGAEPRPEPQSEPEPEPHLGSQPALDLEPAAAGLVECQYKGKGKWHSVWLSLEGDPGSEQLTFKAGGMAGDVLRTACIQGCRVSAPKTPRKGHRHSLRVDLHAKDTKGVKKYIIDAGSEEDLARWMSAFSVDSRIARGVQAHERTEAARVKAEEEKAAAEKAKAEALLQSKRKAAFSQFIEAQTTPDPQHGVVQEIKLCVLGLDGTGKSALVLRFVANHFKAYSESTIGAAFMSKTQVYGDFPVKMQIWDTAGQEKYASLAPMYYSGASAAVVLYDITRMASFKRAQNWVKELLELGPAGLHCTLCGSKLDLDDKRMVEREEAAAYAAEIGASFYEVSSKTGTGVMELFSNIGAALKAQAPLKHEAALRIYDPTGQREMPTGTLVEVDGRKGEVVGFKKQRIGANIHLIQFEGAAREAEVKLKGQEWRIIHS
eukprot:COSAG04_NODE_23_length_37908_cov_41.289825_12_plen_607_part_00